VIAVASEDQSLRVATLALDRQLIDERQLAHAFRAWLQAPERSLGEHLVARGWISADELGELERTLAETPTSPSGSDSELMTLTMPRVIDSLLDLDDLDLGSLPVQMRERISLRGLHSSGGIGEVWRAYDEVLAREIALKRLKRAQSRHPEHRARFFREARITGQLDHPGVVPVYDYAPGDDGSPCFYTMRLVRGRTLAAVVEAFHAEREPGADMLTAALFRLLHAFVSVCRTMAFAHSRGVIHRDLKGENVIIGDYGEVVVLDWGLAKRVGSSADEPDGVDLANASDSLSGLTINETMQGERLGTPAFMAPEQALGRIDHIDRRTDVYGLCALLYHILTGRPPFMGETVVAVMDAVAREPVTPPRELVPELPAALEQICLRGLAKSRDERWPDATSLAEAVDDWINALAERKRNEQERERFFDLSTDLLAILDAGGRLSQTNAAWHRLLGWTELDRGDRVFVELLADQAEQRRQVDATLAALDPGGDPSELELRMRHADGGHRWVHFQVRELPDGGVYLVGRDVTERRRSEQTYIGLLESAPDATCVISADGVITLVNSQLERMFGYDRSELIGQPVEILVPEAVRERHVGHVRRFISQPTTRPMGAGLELRGQTKDGRIIAVEVSLGPVETETGLLVSCALREVEPRPRATRG